jgi:hypothetical protein
MGKLSVDTILHRPSQKIHFPVVLQVTFNFIVFILVRHTFRI